MRLDIDRPRRPTPPLIGSVRQHQLIGIALVAAVVLTIIVSRIQVPRTSFTFTARGTVHLAAATPANHQLHTWRSTGTGCVGRGPYADVAAGTQLVITNIATGKQIAVGRLDSGSIAHGRTCDFTFTVAAVPAVRALYGITVGRRPLTQTTGEDLRHGRFTVTFP